jgi:transposase
MNKIQTKAKKRRRYDAEFKQEAVRLVTHQKQSCADVERALGIPKGVVKDWIRAIKLDVERPFPGNGRKRPNQSELERLEQEVIVLQKERDILKKALAIFSTEPLRYMAS